MKKILILVLSFSTCAYAMRSGRRMSGGRTKISTGMQRSSFQKRSAQRLSLPKPLTQRAVTQPRSLTSVQQRTLRPARLQQRLPSLTTRSPYRQPLSTLPLTRQLSPTRSSSIIRGSFEQTALQPRSSALITGKTFERSGSRQRRPYRASSTITQRRPRHRHRHRHRRRPIIQTYYGSSGYFPYDGYYSDIVPYYGGLYPYPYYRPGTPGFDDDTNIVRPEILGIDPTEYPYYSDIPQKRIPYRGTDATLYPFLQPVEEPYYEEPALEPPIITETPEATVTVITPQAQQPSSDSSDVLSLMDAVLQEQLKDVHEVY